MKKGFTLVELVVSVAIFAMMTALLVVKYGNFNQSVLLTNLAYDVALTVRTAQTYGLSIRGEGEEDTAFQYAYGVAFSSDPAKNKEIILFGTPVSNNVSFEGNGFDGDFTVSRYTLKRGSIVKELRWEGFYYQGVFNTSDYLYVTFKRPDPTANFCAAGAAPECTEGIIAAEVVLEASDGSQRVVKIRNNGQISVLD